ncbi:coiled-coil domain-containing protein [Legionella fallonii]|uniref:Uncharacterized protein n=1 Tax=Legionella fallonii LLAP-10 TaxID=1212491 RepID=A0A098G4X6_9GAMM|nr:hypothetical protein [Legionella fallonii]CEG57538.1 protein of unknown function [coiled-coil domain] [Legionella fallonii LLAP-10]
MTRIHLLQLIDICSQIKSYIENINVESESNLELKNISQSLDNQIKNLYSLQVMATRKILNGENIIEPRCKERLNEATNKTSQILQEISDLIQRIKTVATTRSVRTSAPDGFLSQPKELSVETLFSDFIKNINETYKMIDLEDPNLAENCQIDYLVYTQELFQKSPEQFATFKNDPLSTEQKTKIIDYFYKFRYAMLKNKEPLINFNGRKSVGVIALHVLYGQFGFDHFNNFSEAQKNELIRECDNLPSSPINLGEKISFEEFFAAFYNPEIKANEFGIDINDHTQIYATKLLISAVLTSGIEVKNDNYMDSTFNRSTNPYKVSTQRYRDFLCEVNEKGDYLIKVRHKLLLDNDPIQKHDLNKMSSSPLDLLLAHTYFQTGVWGTMTSHDPITKQKITKELWQNREEHRQLINKELTRLYNDPKTNLVIAALGIALHEAKANILFSGSNLHCGSLGRERGKGAGTAGFYDSLNKVIISNSIINSYNNNIDSTHIGTLIHEGLHFLFDHILKRESSPVIAGSEEERELDRAIIEDQKYRKTLDENTLTSSERSVWTTVVHHLEKEPSYKLDSTNIDNCIYKTGHTMRVEIIVRPMEQIAFGISENAIKKVMPTVYRFYKEKCVPLLEQYVNSNQLKEKGREQHIEREQQLREQQLREQQLREQQLREQQLREQQLREQQLREQQLREQQLREQQLREQQLREQQLREQQLREQQLREQQLREQQLREQQLHEQQLREQQLREQQLSEQQLREQQLREQQLREQQLREQQLREQQLSEQLHKQHRKIFISSTELKINNILDELSRKIGDIDQHHFKEALVTSERLLNALQEAKINYLIELNNLDMNITNVNKGFENTCKALIDKARPMLERDLDWGTYLTNLLKVIANAIIWVASFGQANSFFKQERSESIKIVEAVEQELKL